MNAKIEQKGTDGVDVSVIIVNFNTQELLREALESVLDSTVSKEVIVVDNGSTDGSGEMVRREFTGVHLIANEKNEGFARPNNNAMSLARGRYLFLLNSDASLCPGALERLMSHMEDHLDIGMCGPQLLFPDGGVQRSCRGFISLWTHLCDMFVLDRIFPQSRLLAKSEMTFFDHKSIREVDHLMAAALLVRREVIESIGILDENLSIYYNDMDWSLRARKHGWKIVFLPDAKAFHHHGKTAQMLNVSFELFDELYDNVFYYFRKHYGAWSVVVYKLLMFMGFFPRSLYWSMRSLFDANDKVDYMRDFSWKSLYRTLQVWK